MRYPPRPAMAVIAVVFLAGCGGAPSDGVVASASGLPGGTAGSPARGQAADLAVPFQPVDLSVVLDVAHKAEAVIPIGGGSLKATGADGTTYTLDVPADALPAETTIALTPAKSVTGLPFGGNTTYVVQMSPNGLSLYNFATLTIDPAAELPAEQQVAFGYLGDGKDVISATPVVDSSEIKIRVLHFSGAGVTDGGSGVIDPVRERLGGDKERRIEGALNHVLQVERARQLLGQSQDDDPSVIGTIADFLKQYEDEVVKQRIASAGESCDGGKLALESIVKLGRTRELLGIDKPGASFMEDYLDLVNRAARACVVEEFEACVQHHRIFLMLPLYHSLLRQQAVFPVFTAATLNEAVDLTTKCLTFKLELESTAHLVLVTWTSNSTVTAEVVLRYDPGTELIRGNADYVNTKFDSHFPDCSVATTPGGGKIAVLGLVYEIEGGAPDADGNYPDMQVSDFKLEYSVDVSTEHPVIICPDPPGPPSVLLDGVYPVWSLCYYDARSDQITTASGLRETDWVMHPGDELMADKQWSKVGQENPQCAEQGSFEIHHAPGA